MSYEPDFSFLYLRKDQSDQIRMIMSDYLLIESRQEEYLNSSKSCPFYFMHTPTPRHKFPFWSVVPALILPYRKWLEDTKALIKIINDCKNDTIYWELNELLVKMYETFRKMVEELYAVEFLPMEDKLFYEPPNISVSRNEYGPDFTVRRKAEYIKKMVVELNRILVYISGLEWNEYEDVPKNHYNAWKFHQLFKIIYTQL